MYRLLVLSPKHSGAENVLNGFVTATERSGHRVVRAALSEMEGTDAAAEILSHVFGGQPPTLIVVDVCVALDAALPLRHLQRLLRQVWGEEGGLLPCIAVLSPRHLAQQRLWQAFTADFVVPIAAAEEIMARVEQVLFFRLQSSQNDQLYFRTITLDRANRRVLTREGQIIGLTPREYDLLHFLITHRGKLFARERLLDLVWGVNFEGGARTVDIHVRRLRAKLPSKAAALLETRRGVGYGFVEFPSTSERT